MYPVTTEFQNKIKENARVFKAIVQIQHSAGVLNLTDKDIIGGSMMFNEASQAGEDFTIGSVVASTFSIKLVNKPEYAAINFEGATIIPQIGLLLRENIDTENYFINAPQPSEFEEGDGEEIWEYVPLGRFNIDEAKKLRNTVEIKAIDNMIEFDKPYSLSNLSYPASLYQIYVNACNACDAIVGATDFPNKDYIVDNRPEGEYTFRDIIGYVAALSGTFARCNRNGATELTWYKDTEIELGPQNRFSFLPREDLIKITGVRFETEDSVYLTGTDDYVVDLSDNPLLQGEYETVLPNIFNNIKDIAFTPFESSWQGNPALQAGDIITQTDRDGDVYNTVITHSTYKYRGASSFSGKGLPLKAKGYRGSTNKKIAKVRRVLEDSFNRRINEMQKVIEDGMIVTYYQVEEPDDAKRGDLWYDSENEKLKRYDGLTWALITDKGIVEAIEKAQDAQSTADGKIVTYYQVEEPNGSIGDLWIDINDNNKLYRFDGEEWIDIQDKNITDLIDAITDINSDISTLETAVLNATELIANMLGGYAHYEAEAFYVSDNPVLAEAQKVWKWGIGGFGYSENGIEGPYTTAITADGSIVAMNIAAKIIAASMVRTGLLSSEDGSTWINLDDGTFNLKDKIKYVDNKFTIALTNEDVKDVIPYTIIFSNENQSFITNNNGTVPSATIISSDINVYRGAEKVNATIGTPILRNLSDQPVSGGNITKTNPTTTGSGNVVWIIPSGVNVSSDSGYIHIPITVDGTTFNKKLTWSKAQSGKDGTDGVDGQDGESRYLWIRYSQNANGDPFVTDPTNAKYIGIATTLTNNPPSHYLSYTWSLIKGTDGIPGEPGTDGRTSYLHIKYSDNGTSFTSNNGETVGAYIGTYVDFIEADSMTFSKYTWNKVRGTDGKDGTDGTDAKIVTIAPSNSHFTTDTISANLADYIYAPTNIILTPTFQNCIYSKWEYSLNGTSWTTVTSGSRGLTINGTTRALTISNTSNLYSSSQSFVIFRVTSSTNEYDLITIPRLYDSTKLSSRVTTVEHKVTDEAIIGAVERKVTAGESELAMKSEIKQTAESWVARFGTLQNLKIRYIRDWLNGSLEAPTLSYWNEISVKDTNGQEASSFGSITASSAQNATYPLTRWTDGSLSTYARVTGTGWQYLQWDWGVPTDQIAEIGIKHHTTGRRYNHKLEVSEDGITWISLYNSEIDGVYPEGTTAKLYNINQFKQGVTTINSAGVKVEHSGLGGQYSEMRADGFVRKWQYGEANYLNDIWVGQFDEQGTDFGTSRPTPWRIYLPARFSGRLNTKIVMIPTMLNMNKGRMSTEFRNRVEELVTYHQIRCQVSRPRGTTDYAMDLSANPPWVEVDVFERLEWADGRGIVYTKYTGLDYTVLAIGE